MTMFGMRAWRIGKIMGIPISIDLSWLLIFGLLTFSLAGGLFPLETRFGRVRGLNIEALALGAVTSLLLFGSVLAHELSHSWMARRRGIPVLGITLFIFGGVAQIGDEPDSPATEFLIAIMGPLMSLALAALFAILWIWPSILYPLVSGAAGVLRPLIAMGYYLATANAMLVIFNLLPGFPLDGGRVARAMIWAFLHDLTRATRVAMWGGRLIAGLMVLLSLFLLVRGDFNALWFLLIAVFIWQAAGEAYRSVLFREALKRVQVDELMVSPVPRVPADLTLPALVESHLIRTRGSAFGVEEGGQTIGLIGGAQLRHVARAGWADKRVKDVMAPLDRIESVRPDDTALAVMLKLMKADGADPGELPVMFDGQLVGLVGQEEIGRYLKWKAR